jgi:N-acetylmuramoyl-L-alanine amidase
VTTLASRVSLASAAILVMLVACSSSHPAAAPRSASPTAVAPASVIPTAKAPTHSLRPSPVPSLAGRTVVIDPGHNGRNAAASAVINQLVPAGGFQKPCDTTGTETDAGYPEYAFTLEVADRAAILLRLEGARVLLTRTTSSGVGPCVNVRAAIGNDAHADAAISIHADGGPASGFGFHVIEPSLAPDAGNAAILAPSGLLALAVRAAFTQATGEPFANYIAQQGLIARNDLGGLNLSRVPKVFIECANMRNAEDAQRLTDPTWREKAAEGIVAGITRYLQS